MIHLDRCQLEGTKVEKTYDSFVIQHCNYLIKRKNYSLPCFTHNVRKLKHFILFFFIHGIFKKIIILSLLFLHRQQKKHSYNYHSDHHFH